MSEWIKYEDASPCEDGDFMVFCPDYHPAIIIATYDADLGGWLDFSDEEITHWQPLPEPPND